MVQTCQVAVVVVVAVVVMAVVPVVWEKGSDAWHSTRT
jgi:hypothetical protein